MYKNFFKRVYGLVLSILVVAYALTSCSSGGGGGADQEEDSPVVVTVDSNLVVSHDTLPPLDDSGIERKIAVIEDHLGNRSSFIENEIVVTGVSEAKLQEFLDRWNGVIIKQTDPKEVIDFGIDPTYLVRIETADVDADNLAKDLSSLEPNAYGEHKISSDTAAKTLSVATQAAIDGLTVGINWLGEPDSIATRTTIEASSGPINFSSNAGGQYSPNSFNWDHLRAGNEQNIGVTEAWYLLDRTGRINNRIKIAILDMGFFLDLDVADNYVALSNVPFTDAMSTTNLSSCSGGNPCPWHGSNVAEAAFGLVGNNIGGAGPAGPVADPVLVFTSGDIISAQFAIGQAVAAGARIINMSFSVKVPALLTWSVVPFDLYTAGIASSGILLFAAAGNSTTDVDAEECFLGDVLGTCWEKTWHTPCENNGVICVGGLARNSKMRADFGNDSGSNYGLDDVDIYAPFTVLVSRDPQTSTPVPDYAVPRSGTSFSSPYAAGVAGLIWAANPELSAEKVRDILFDTAHKDSDDRSVGRYVNAQAAVKRALGTLSNIIAPANNAVFDGHQLINFRGFGFSSTRGVVVNYTWVSNRDGEIGQGETLSYRDLTPGSHQITLEAHFGDGFVARHSINITINSIAPTVTMTSPSAGNSSFYQGQRIDFSVNTSDNTFTGRLEDSNIVWYVDNMYVGNGHGFQYSDSGSLSLGNHTVRVVGSHVEGLSDEASQVITITSPPVDLYPTAQIISPLVNEIFSATTIALGASVTLDWIAEDDNGVASVQWSYSRDGAGEVIFEPQFSFYFDFFGNLISYFYVQLYPADCHSDFIIFLRVTDTAGQTITTSVPVSVIVLC